MTPSEQAVAWLRSAMAEMPPDIKMIYVESGEHVTPDPENRTVARYDLVGFRSIPRGGFDPDNDDHVADLGEWDWEAEPHCEFPDAEFESYDWLELLDSAVRDSEIIDLLNQREVVLLFADHDGPVSMLP
jgi:hypothetical protein